ncbi:hypothetical protein BJV78DRAFT_1217858 [Lactifluus subvellereus]|nr:hypothetical protein BJV78DRAFT_1217858 [Lactifluus subvellereus]
MSWRGRTSSRWRLNGTDFALVPLRWSTQCHVMVGLVVLRSTNGEAPRVYKSEIKLVASARPGRGRPRTPSLPCPDRVASPRFIFRKPNKNSSLDDHPWIHSSGASIPRRCRAETNHRRTNASANSEIVRERFYNTVPPKTPNAHGTTSSFCPVRKSQPAAPTTIYHTRF